MARVVPALTEEIARSVRSNDSPARPRNPGAPHYRTIHKIRQACEAEGWQLDYCQIDPGNLSARISTRNFGAVSVIQKKVSLRVEVVGRSPSDHMTLITPVSGNSMWANGRSIDENQALLLGPDARLQLVAGPAALIQMRVPCALLYHYDLSDPWVSTSSSRTGTFFLDMRADKTRSLRRLMRDTMLRGRNRDACRHAEHRFAKLTFEIIDDAIKRQGIPDQIADRESWRTINRACEFIWANQHRPISLADICDHAIASVSKLERTFRRELDVSPGNYVRARRLSAINRALCSAVAPNSKVSALALDHGFRHLGRFAADYRRHFGELPSETLRNGRAPQSPEWQ